MSSPDYRGDAHRLLGELKAAEGYSARFWYYHHALYDFEDYGAEETAWRQVAAELRALTASK